MNTRPGNYGDGDTATIAGWMHQLTATTRPDGTLAGHGVRDGKAMISTLRRRLVRIPAASSATPAGSPYDYHQATTSSPRSSPASAPYRHRPDHRPRPRQPPEPANPARPPGPAARPATETTPRKINKTPPEGYPPLLADSGLRRTVSFGSDRDSMSSSSHDAATAADAGLTSVPVTALRIHPRWLTNRDGTVACRCRASMMTDDRGG